MRYYQKAPVLQINFVKTLENSHYTPSYNTKGWGGLLFYFGGLDGVYVEGKSTPQEKLFFR